MYPDFMLAMAGDEWVDYQRMMEEAAALRLIKKMLDERMAWTAATDNGTPLDTVARVEAVVRFAQLRSVTQ